MGESWLYNIGEIEKQTLYTIGKEFSIEPLLNLEKYLSKQPTLFLLDDIHIEFCDNPFVNLIELARKVPTCLSNENLAAVWKLGEAKFNEKIYNLFNRVSSSESLYLKRLEVTIEDSLLKIIFDDFFSFINSNSITSEQLHYTMQTTFQTVYSNIKDRNSTYYLLASLLSCRYKVDKCSFENDLYFDFKACAGSIFNGDILDYQLYNRSLEYVKLSSLEGVVKGDRLSYFSRFFVADTFVHDEGTPINESILIKSSIQHKNTKLYCEKYLFVSKRDKLGTDFPHFHFIIDELGEVLIHYSYTHLMGQKPHYFYHKVISEVLAVLEDLFPGFDAESFKSKSVISKGADCWQQINSAQSRHKSKSVVNSPALRAYQNGKEVVGITYLGPFTRSSMGLYAYLCDLLKTC